VVSVLRLVEALVHLESEFQCRNRAGGLDEFSASPVRQASTWSIIASLGLVLDDSSERSPSLVCSVRVAGRCPVKPALSAYSSSPSVKVARQPPRIP